MTGLSEEGYSERGGPHSLTLMAAVARIRTEHERKLQNHRLQHVTYPTKPYQNCHTSRPPSLPAKRHGLAFLLADAEAAAAGRFTLVTPALNNARGQRAISRWTPSCGTLPTHTRSNHTSPPDPSPGRSVCATQPASAHIPPPTPCSLKYAPGTQIKLPALVETCFVDCQQLGRLPMPRTAGHWRWLEQA